MTFLEKLDDTFFRFCNWVLGPYPEDDFLQLADNVCYRPLHVLGKEILEINRNNGWAVATPESWSETYKVPAVLALIHSEVSEALEDFRHGRREHFEEELADTLIRVLDLSHGLGIDMDKAVADKLQKNRGRGFRHGGKRV